MQDAKASKRQHEESRLSTAFLHPLQAQFYVPDNGSWCTAKRLIDFSLNLPLSEDLETRELKSAAENLVCSMHCLLEGQRRLFYLRIKTVFPLRVCHLLLRCKYLCKENAWKELAFQSKLSIWTNKFEATLFWVRKDLVRHDANYKDRYRILVDFDIVHSDWFPPENLHYSSRSTQTCPLGASPKKTVRLTDLSETGHNPDSNLIVEVEGKRFHTFCDLLTMASPVFAKIISQASLVTVTKEQDEAQSYSKRLIRLPGKSAIEIEELLLLLQPATPRRLSLRLAPAILVLADEYQIDHIKETAEELIVSSYAQHHQHYSYDAGTVESDLPCPMEGYALARTYNCQQLESVCLNRLTKWGVEKILGNDAFHRMDKEDKCALALARMKLMEAGSNQ